MPLALIALKLPQNQARKLRLDQAPESAHHLAVIERNANAQTRLVSDLLDVSRIINGKLQLSLVKTELLALLLAAADVVRPAAEGKGVELVHGRMSISAREAAMDRFRSGESFLLVATTVIEVGVDDLEASSIAA